MSDRLAHRWAWRDERGPAVVVVATALLSAGAAGEGWLLAPALVLGAVLCLLCFETGSVLPGAVVSATWSAAVLGVGFRWGAADASRSWPSRAAC